MTYEKPTITVLGSIAEHTWTTFPPKSDGSEPWHYDKFCEMSGGSDPDAPGC